MFKKTSLKLTLLYLAILTIISLFFSFSIYYVLVRELERSVDRQYQVLAPFYSTDTIELNSLLRERQLVLNDAKNTIVLRLLMTNLILLAGSGFLSYYLALRSLKPIENSHLSQRRFTADASHELRTPITAMKSEIEVALSDKNLSITDARDLLNSNLEELDKLTAIIEGLLGLAKLDEGAPNLGIVNLESIIQSAIDRVLLRAEQKSVLINAQVDEDIRIMADKGSLTEAFSTLLDNAIKYSPSQSEVLLKTNRQKDHVIIKIIDHGHGIEEEDLPFIFDRFYRADKSRNKNKTTGYGLGLSIAKNIFNLHKAEVKVASKIGHGTTFFVNFPVVKKF